MKFTELLERERRTEQLWRQWRHSLREFKDAPSYERQKFLLDQAADLRVVDKTLARVRERIESGRY